MPHRTPLNNTNQEYSGIRMTGCSYMTAMVLLTANSMHRPRHGDLSLDRYLVESGLRTVDRLVKEIGNNGTLQSFRMTCTELHQRTQERCAEAAITVKTVGSST